MAKVYSELDNRLINFISSQPMFFVATAPCLDESGFGGHVNVSPKGYRDTFAILDSLTVAYLDLTGSGAETIAHLRQNGRITIMFCSFDRTPKILRLYGTGQVILPDDPRWPEFAFYFPSDENDINPECVLHDAGGANACRDGNGDADAPRRPNAVNHREKLSPLDPLGRREALSYRDELSRQGSANHPESVSHQVGDGDREVDADRWGRFGTGMDRGNRRAIIVTSIDRISDSCGYAVPVMDLVEERDMLARWAERRSAENLLGYRIKHNSVSIDGLPGLS